MGSKISPRRGRVAGEHPAVPGGVAVEDGAALRRTAGVDGVGGASPGAFGAAPRGRCSCGSSWDTAASVAWRSASSRSTLRPRGGGVRDGLVRRRPRPAAAGVRGRRPAACGPPRTSVMRPASLFEIRSITSTRLIRSLNEPRPAGTGWRRRRPSACRRRSASRPAVARRPGRSARPHRSALRVCASVAWAAVSRSCARCSAATAAARRASRRSMSAITWAALLRSASVVPESAPAPGGVASRETAIAATKAARIPRRMSSARVRWFTFEPPRGLPAGIWERPTSAPAGTLPTGTGSCNSASVMPREKFPQTPDVSAVCGVHCESA